MCNNIMTVTITVQCHVYNDVCSFFTVHSENACTFLISYENTSGHTNGPV